ADAPGVPARVGRAVAGGRGDGREDALAADEVEEVRVPGARVIVRLQANLPLLLEELDRLPHHLAGAVVGVRAGEMAGVQQGHGASISGAWRPVSRHRRVPASGGARGGTEVPQVTASRPTRLIGRLYLRARGWRVEGALPAACPRAVVVAAP